MPAFVIYRPHSEKIPYKFQYDAWSDFIYGSKMKIQTYHDLYKCNTNTILENNYEKIHFINSFISYCLW